LHLQCFTHLVLATTQTLLGLCDLLIVFCYSCAPVFARRRKGEEFGFITPVCSRRNKGGLFISYPSGAAAEKQIFLKQGFDLPR